MVCRVKPVIKGKWAWPVDRELHSYHDNRTRVHPREFVKPINEREREEKTNIELYRLN